ncbi:MAG: hypothetical protein AB7O44_12860 [Hyphomicrobiaceae bacterium]
MRALVGAWAPLPRGGAVRLDGAILDQYGVAALGRDVGYLTLAWLSPVSHAHQEYRRAQLLVDAPSHRQELGFRRAVGSQPSDYASKRGSLIHEICEGEEAIVFVDEGCLVLRVWCREKTFMRRSRWLSGMRSSSRNSQNSRP